jgi:hypothetical protein
MRVSGSRAILGRLGHCLKPLPVFLRLAVNAFSASDKTLFDFQSATNAAWRVVNDNVMGGVSTSRFEATNGVALFRGDVSLENNGGFASVRSSLANERHATPDCRASSRWKRRRL